jgi:hypothetical protein
MDPDPPAVHRWSRRLISGVGKLLRRNPAQQLDWFLAYRYWRLAFYYWRVKNRRGRRRVQPEELGSEVSAAEDQGSQRPGVLARRDVGRADWLRLYEWAAAGYRPQSYAGSLTLFWTAEEPWRQEGWRKVMAEQTQANEVENQVIPGDHITSRTEYLPVLAEQVRRCLEKAQARELS